MGLKDRVRNARGSLLAMAVAMTIAALIIVFGWHPGNVSNSSPTDSPSASVSAAPDSAQPMGPGLPGAAPAAGNPKAAVDPFTREVLAFEAAKNMENADQKNAALAQVSTPDYLAKYRMPPNSAQVDLTVTAIPDKSQVFIHDESQLNGVTYRIVSDYVYIEKRDKDGKLVTVLDNLPERTTTWELNSSGDWRVAKEGM